MSPTVQRQGRTRVRVLERSLQLRVLAGVYACQKLRLRGKGGKGRVDSQGVQGADGNRYLHISLALHPIWEQLPASGSSLKP